MRSTSLKSTTALLLSLGVALPTLGYAQETAPDAADICPEDMSEADCEIFLETEAETETEAEAETSEDPEPAEPAGEGLLADGDIPADGSDPADGNTAAEQGSETVQPAPADPAPAEETTAPAEPADGNTAADPEAVVTEGEAAPDPNAPADPEAVVETPDPSVVTEDAEIITPDAAETPAPEIIEAPVEDVATEEASPETDTAIEAETTEEAPADPVEQTQADPVPETETETVETDTADPVTEETAPSDQETATETEATTDPETTPDTDVAVEEPEVIQDDTEESTAAANETPEAEATANVEVDAALEDGEVQTEVVTEETTRSSDQDFETSASGNDDDEGLSNLEKFALGAAGLVVLDQIIGQDEQVVSNTGDRLVVQRNDGEYYVLKDDNALLRQPGVEVSTRTFDDGSTLQRVNREDGSQVVTIRAANGQVLRRSRILPDGTEVLLFDDTAEAEPVEVTELPAAENRSISLETATEEELRAALFEREVEALDRRFTLQQVRQIRAVRELVPVIELDAVTFNTGSAAIRSTEVDDLIAIGDAMNSVIAENPYEVFMIEGHTDAVGSATSNLALSDRRAESVALALTEYFDVPPENMIVQGYGEANLKVRTQGAERQNRRATVRRITPLLRTALAD